MTTLTGKRFPPMLVLPSLKTAQKWRRWYVIKIIWLITLFILNLYSDQSQYQVKYKYLCSCTEYCQFYPMSPNDTALRPCCTNGELFLLLPETFWKCFLARCLHWIWWEWKVLGFHRCPPWVHPIKIWRLGCQNSKVLLSWLLSSHMLIFYIQGIHWTLKDRPWSVWRGWRLCDYGCSCWWLATTCG